MAKEMIEKKEVKKANIEFERKKMREMVPGIFRFYEVPGGSISFNYREFKGDPIEKYTMMDGCTYTVPLGVARHLNKNGWYPEYGHVNIPGAETVNNAIYDANGIEQRVVKKVRRYSFQSLQFTDVEEMNMPDKQIIQVQTVVS
jgi:hypothetical protein